MQHPPEIRLVVLDWAGTAIDFGCMAPAGAFVAVFAEFGVEVSVADARRPMGLHKKDHLRAMLGEPHLAERWRAARGRDWTAADVDALYQMVTPMQVAAAERHSALIPGVVGCVAELRRRGVKVAATTGYFREAAAVVCEAARNQGYIPDFSICADDVPAGRPAPWMIFRAMEATVVYPPAAVVKVGDTPVDIADGRNAGVWSVGVIDSSNEMGLTPEELAGLPPAELEARRERVLERYEAARCDAAVRTIDQLPSLVAEINEQMAMGARPGS